ncbi:hypothetical protein GDO86_009494 [Hymenochirus boettgeri]|uniref:Phosphatidylinositol N-acetylglucosaminyltransferase subunit H conserved domain-containing protein n=1 Tax=Hymenochirus boettgeri TaxID=247094 RepID=A0A8T2JKR6_9PIPI|nr:hypothetical protein GDO86_009494 [Hymenochirus boettgeri]
MKTYIQFWKVKTMETKEYLEVCGEKIMLYQQPYSASCREFQITCTKLSVRTLALYTSIIWLAAYSVFIYTQNSMVLSASIIGTIFGLLFYLHFMKIDQETLLVIDSLGIQLTTSFASGKENTMFIEKCRVKDVIINETFYMIFQY